MASRQCYSGVMRSEHERVHALLQRHGWNATSFQVLEPGFQYWFDPLDETGCVAYVDSRDAWVAAGSPIAAEAALGAVAARFVEAARRAGKVACFFGTEARFAALSGTPQLCIGEQPVWDPSQWEAMVGGARSLKEQLRRARAKGVIVRELAARELADGTPLRLEVDALLATWLASRRMAPMGFLVGVELFGYAGERRYFAAEREGTLVALLAAVPVYARRGWLIEDLLRDPAAPNGTAESLVDAAMRAFARSGSRYATMGLAPLAGEVGSFLRSARAWGELLYDFDGVRAFKARLRPDRWDPIYLAYPGTSPFRAMTAVLRAFAGGNLVRFGLQTVLRGPPLIVRLLSVLLLPWSLALSLANTDRWFPSHAIQLGWIGFDLALCGALWALSRKWRTRLALGLAGLISADALLTLIEAALFNLPRIHNLPDALIVSAGVLAPIAAATVLWGALGVRAGRWS
jgi:phosphatidylglycerol lysyltransferase